jgi:anti-sigma B factor antagonist
MTTAIKRRLVSSVETTTDGIHIIRLKDIFDASTVSEFEKVVSYLAARNFFKLVVDMQQAEFISEAGWGAFTAELRRCRENGGDIKLVGMSADIFDVFLLLELDSFITAYDTVEEAISAFGIANPSGNTITFIDKKEERLLNSPPQMDDKFPHSSQQTKNRESKIESHIVQSGDSMMISKNKLDEASINPLKQMKNRESKFESHSIQPSNNVMMSQNKLNEASPNLPRQTGSSENKTKPHVFLSYSRKDKEAMQFVRTNLSAKGLTVWTDDINLEPGTPTWTSAIEDAIEHAGCTVVILSPNAKQSIWVEREITYSEAHTKRIFPFLIEGDTRSAVPIRLVSSQLIDARDNYSSAIQHLIFAVNKHLEQFLD